MSFKVIKEDDLFYLSNRGGNVPNAHANTFGYGLYTKDTRVLSQLGWRMGPDVLLELEATDAGNYEAVYKYTNREWSQAGQVEIPRESILVKRRQLVDGRMFYEEGRVQNYSGKTLSFDMEYQLAADFRDMFEVRGFSRNQQAGTVSVAHGDDWVRFTHTAADEVISETTVRLTIFTDLPVKNVTSAHGRLRSKIHVPPYGHIRWLLVVEPLVNAQGHLHGISENDLEEQYQKTLALMENEYDNWLKSSPCVKGDKNFERWYIRGLKDIRMLLSDMGYGQFPVAGVPWFAVPFGRDSLISSLQLLLVNSKVAKGTLATMAAFQGTKVNPERDEQPGKIMHELRSGELTRTGEVPFGPYFGTIDATPLFLNLAADYYAWTKDRTFVEQLMSTVERAFNWIEQYGDRDGDGFVEYFQEASDGIANQGWKDSGDSMMHKDGTLAKAPIALCEVQGYVYRAYQRWAELYKVLGNLEKSEECKSKAEQLRKQFIEAFWMENESAVALALDAGKKKVESISSNMGQVLWSGILPHELAIRLVNRLLKDDMFNGFGIRTLSSAELAYNPLSYHNGSIWPHDNSLIVAGMKRYGRTDAAATVVHGLFQAAHRFPHMRLPELFSGFGSNEVDEPLPYPVSCSPQAWAAATPAFLLQTLLGIEPHITDSLVNLNPFLPIGIDELTVTGLHIADGQLDFVLRRTSAGDTTIQVLQNTTGHAVLLGIPSGGEC